MHAKFLWIAALACVAALARPTRIQRSAGEISSDHLRVIAFDQGQDATRPPRRGGGDRNEHSTTIDVFPNMSVPASEPQTQAPSSPGVHSPGQTIHAPAEHSPAAPSQPKFSPRLQPPNGKTDGKIYPA